ncbi:MAG TPA: hemolysin family protein [Thermodesulfobacteriota bacterium]|nr:hemolysin family protein [Thermodesulfobacteriota bacterium]
MAPFVWLVILLLISVNAFYVLAEFASVNVRRSRIQQLAEEGNALASSLLPVLEDTRRLDRYIAACQIGITLSSLGLGAYGQASLAPQIAPLFERWGGLQGVAAYSTSAIVVLISLTILQMILGELVPKSVALQYPTQTALYTVFPMRWSLKLFSWFIAVLNGSGVAILKLLGVSEYGHRHIHSPEEIELLITESHEGGLLEPDEQRRLNRALKLGKWSARQLMIPKSQISALDVNTPPQELLQKVANSPYTRLPVYRDSTDNVIGMLHTKDLAVRYAEQGSITSIEEVMRPVTVISENVTADRLLTILRERRSHQGIVVDEFGRVAGLVTLEDVLAKVLGEVTDEFKTGQPKPERLPDGRVRLPGLMRLDEAESWIGVRWQGKSNTIGGQVVEALGYIPAAGERVTINGVDVEVEKVANRTVAYVLVTPPASNKEDMHG